MIAYYLKEVLDTTRREATVKQTVEALTDVDFGTIAVRGVSGLVLGSVIASAMNKALAVIRKPGEGSHSCYPVEGAPVGNYVIVDDLVCTGNTVETIKQAMQTHHPESLCAGIYLYSQDWVQNQKNIDGFFYAENDLEKKLFGLGVRPLNPEFKAAYEALAA